MRLVTVAGIEDPRERYEAASDFIRLARAQTAEAIQVRNEAIRQALDADHSLSFSEVSRRTGLSRTEVTKIVRKPA